MRVQPSAATNQPARQVTPSRTADRPLTVWFIAMSTLLAVFSLACGSGGGGGGGTSGTGTGTTSTSMRLEFFQASLDAIDPRDPATVIVIDAAAAEIEAGVNDVGALPAVRATSIGMTLTDVVIEYVIYPRDDGTLYRVSTDASAGIPTPVRVSNTTNALPLCSSSVGLDFQIVEDTRFAYGSDGQDCTGSLTWWMVSLDDDETTPPQTFPGRPLTPLVDNVTGVHTGWLSLDGGTLKRLAPDLSVQADDLAQGVVAGETLGATKNGVVFIELDQALYGFNPGSDTLTDFGFDFSDPCPCDTSFAADSEFAFLVDQGELFRADPTSGLVESLDAPMDAFPNAPQNINPGLTLVLAGTARVAWSYFADGDGNLGTTTDQFVMIRSVARDGADAFDLDELEPSTVGLLGLAPFNPVTSGEWIFFNKVTFDAINFSDFRANAVALRLDGTSTRVQLDSFWIGTSILPELGTEVSNAANHLTRADDLPDLSNFGGSGVITLTSVDARDPTAAEVFLGRLPARGDIAFAIPGLGPERVGAMLATDGSGGFQTDIIYWVDGLRDSLRVLTNTGSLNEFPAPLF
jgi:hypothetical protein